MKKFLFIIACLFGITVNAQTPQADTSSTELPVKLKTGLSKADIASLYPHLNSHSIADYRDAAGLHTFEVQTVPARNVKRIGFGVYDIIHLPILAGRDTELATKYDEIVMRFMVTPGQDDALETALMNNEDISIGTETIIIESNGKGPNSASRMWKIFWPSNQSIKKTN